MHLLFAFVLTFVSFASNAQPKEVEPVDIPLPFELESKHAEISGLAWYKDWLIILPQYPDFHRHGHFLYAIKKADIYAYLDKQQDVKLKRIPFDTGVFESQLSGFEGFESIAFDGESAYLTIETTPENQVSAVTYIVKGTMAQDLSRFSLNNTAIAKHTSQSGVSNMAEESLLLASDSILTFHEANGHALVKQPKAHSTGYNGEVKASIAFPHVSYRITDVTALDNKQRFWGVNYFYEGDKELAVKQDPLFAVQGKGKTHNKFAYVERLIEFQLRDKAITMTNTPALQLKLSGKAGNNWEGLVRLDDKGFLLATDKFPRTRLAFVPYP